MLRHQLTVLRRRLHGRVRLTNRDRWFFTQLYRWFPAILRVQRRLEARRGLTDGFKPENSLWFSLTLNPMLPGEAALGHALNEPVGRFTHDCGAGLGERLQTGSKVDRITVK